MKTVFNKLMRECGKSPYQGSPDDIKSLSEPVKKALEDTLVSPEKVEQFPRGTVFKPMFSKEQQDAMSKLEDETNRDKSFRSVY